MEVKPIEDELDEITRKIKVISVDEKFEEQSQRRQVMEARGAR
jgi:hypothetical protein